MRIEIDLDDVGVVNYVKFEKLIAIVGLNDYVEFDEAPFPMRCEAKLSSIRLSKFIRLTH